MPKKNATPNVKFNDPDFLKRIRFAKLAEGDAVLSYFYSLLEIPGYSLFERAYMDTVIPPNIVSVGWKHYTGQLNDQIPILAFDDSAVITVYVTISNANDEVIEEGYALPTETGDYWYYNVAAENSAIEGCSITVEAMDMPENITAQTFRIPA